MPRWFKVTFFLPLFGLEGVTFSPGFPWCRLRHMFQDQGFFSKTVGLMVFSWCSRGKPLGMEVSTIKYQSDKWSDFKYRISHYSYGDFSLRSGYIHPCLPPRSQEVQAFWEQLQRRRDCFEHATKSAPTGRTFRPDSREVPPGWKKRVVPRVPYLVAKMVVIVTIVSMLGFKL